MHNDSQNRAVSPSDTEKEERMDRQVLSVEEAAQALSIGRGLAYQMVAEGKIPSIRLGRRLLIPKARIDRMLAGGDGDDRQAAA